MMVVSIPGRTRLKADVSLSLIVISSEILTRHSQNERLNDHTTSTLFWLDFKLDNLLNRRLCIAAGHRTICYTQSQHLAITR